MRRHCLRACVWLLLLVPVSRADVLPRGDAKAAGFAPEKLERISAALKEAVEKKQIPGASALIARHGKVVSFSAVGMQDVEGKAPLTDATIFRIASMSKPITSVAVMILVEDGKIAVTDPLSKYVPEFKDMKVLIPGKDDKYETVPAEREITIHDLLTHTSGLTYGLMNKPIITKLYAEGGVADGLSEPSGTIGDNVKRLAKMPLVCQPGSAWEYGLSTDVLGRVVEVASGKTLDEFLRERIFQPLKMTDTYFVLPKEKHSRLSTLYLVGEDKMIHRVGDEAVKAMGANVYANYPTRQDSKYYSGGAGLVSTAGDYFRFCQMMLNGGELDGARVLKPETVKRMTQNQLGKLRIQFPGNDLMGYGFGVLSEEGKEKTKELAGVGSFSWGGAFNTFFWVDPKNDLVAVFMSQVFPPDFVLPTEFKRLTYEALQK
jgi:CubicO group peptidase (beta-lactamase class C family)